MNEKEKFVIAKNNYECFWSNLEETTEEEREFVHTYVHLKNGKVIEDFYWTDNTISPTAVYQWLKKYNRQAVKKDSWATKVVLPYYLFETLVSMTDNPKGNSVTIKDVEIVYNER